MTTDNPNKEGFFSFTGKVYELEEVMDDMRYFSGAYALSKMGHDLGKLIEESWPNGKAWKSYHGDMTNDSNGDE